jgi:ribonuclease HII
LSIGVGSVPAHEIDRLGILPATREAMRQAVVALAPMPDYLLIDAVRLPALTLPQFSRPKGDRDCLSIAAASIIAKVTRDRWMQELELVVPGYGLAAHKGYGTALHRHALQQLGPSEYHRLSFAPLRLLNAALADDQG